VDKKKALAAASGAAAGFVAGRLVDLALMGGLVFTAAGAVGFAGYETMVSDHRPQINGMQYLAIFAQPSHHLASPDGAKAPLDMDPVGALPRAAPVEANGYSLVGAQSRFAWLREGNRIFAVNPGDDVPRLGRVASIEPREGRWALIGPKGDVLIVGAPVDIGEPSAGRFDKRMIFKDAR
jgi:hypothetical protein